MNCPYCNKDLDSQNESLAFKSIKQLASLIPKPNLYIKIDPRKTKQDSRNTVCDVCRCFFSLKNEKLIKTIFMLNFNGLEYFIILDHENIKTTLTGPTFPQYERHMNETQPVHTTAWHSIIKFNHLISISPANAHKKLQLMLTMI
jgi:hypothetical protein